MSGAGLAVTDLTVRYGGLIAVDGVSLVAPPGRVTGLIGPNGAGKTTTFDACSGLVGHSGRVVLDGADLTGRAPSRRAALGLGRTFQRIGVFGSLTVLDNVALGVEAGQAGASPWRQLVAGRGQVEAAGHRARASLELCGIGHLAAASAGSLSTGQRRLVELARVLAGDFRMLLLDEPSSGLDRQETVAFADVLRRAVEQRGIGILLVEHDMDLALGLCEHLYVLDFGRLLFDGGPAAVRDSPAVRTAYLGAVG